MNAIDSGIRVGKYEVGRKLGQGGFGILYVARDHELGREVAIKFLRPEHVFKPNVVQRFLQEARAAARINHPGIVTVFESGIVGGTNTRADGTVFISMELLTGDTLAQKIKNVGRMPTMMALNYARQLASALGAAHQAGIVHRDLKPANIFIVADPAVTGGDRLKVLDFGIAKLADDFGSGVQTHSMLMLGTPMYMSPEQCKSSAKVDQRSDIYSLGCILFEMLCGQPPFDGDSGELIAKHQLVPPPTMGSLIGAVPEPLERLVASMLAKSAGDRPQTMGLVEDALVDLDSRAVERPSIAEGTVRELAGDAPTTIEPSAMRKRMPFIAGGLGAAALGIMVGLLSMCGDKKPPSAQANVTGDAAVAIQPIVTNEPPPIDAGSATESVEDIAAALRLECVEHQANLDWTGLSSCAERLAQYDPDAAQKFGATARAELIAAREFAAIEEAIERKDKARAKLLLAEMPKTSVYRRDAEEVVDTGKTTMQRKASCNAEALKDKGMENVNMGQHGAALTQFEQSLKCRQDPYVRSLAFMAACNSQNLEKARAHYARLPADQRTKYSVMCERNKIPKSKLASTDVEPPPGCDAEALKDKALENTRMGQHAAALAQFEASLRCKNDSLVLSYAFMAACNAQNAMKAKHYFSKLTPAQQTKYKVMCVRNHIDLP